MKTENPKLGRGLSALLEKDNKEAKTKSIEVDKTLSYMGMIKEDLDKKYNLTDYEALNLAYKLIKLEWVM